jgi:hypothetical protein
MIFRIEKSTYTRIVDGKVQVVHDKRTKKNIIKLFDELGKNNYSQTALESAINYVDPAIKGRIADEITRIGYDPAVLDYENITDPKDPRLQNDDYVKISFKGSDIKFIKHKPYLTGDVEVADDQLNISQPGRFLKNGGKIFIARKTPEANIIDTVKFRSANKYSNDKFEPTNSYEDTPALKEAKRKINEQKKAVGGKLITKQVVDGLASDPNFMALLDNPLTSKKLDFARDVMKNPDSLNTQFAFEEFAKKLAKTIDPDFASKVTGAKVKYNRATYNKVGRKLFDGYFSAELPEEVVNKLPRYSY